MNPCPRSQIQQQIEQQYVVDPHGALKLAGVYDLMKLPDDSRPADAQTWTEHVLRRLNEDYQRKAS